MQHILSFFIQSKKMSNKIKVIGTVIAVKKQWWLKINTKPVRTHSLDGAIFPHIIKVHYNVDGKDLVVRKWVAAGVKVPYVGEKLTVSSPDGKPQAAAVHWNGL